MTYSKRDEIIRYNRGRDFNSVWEKECKLASDITRENKLAVENSPGMLRILDNLQKGLKIDAFVFVS